MELIKNSRKRRNLKILKESFRTTIFVVVCYFAIELFSNIAQQLQHPEGSPAKNIKEVTSNITTIFFVESSLNGQLTMKQLVSVESAAYHNPNKKVLVLVMSKTKTITPTSHMALLNKTYPNMNYVGLDIGGYFKGTCLERWFVDGKWSKSRFKTAHLSEAIRYLYLFKFGGIYLDLDVVSLTRLDLSLNTITYDNQETLAVSFLAFHKEHPLMLRVLDKFDAEYNPDVYIGNGASLLTSTYEKYKKEELNNEQKVQLLPLSDLHPVLWVEGKSIFDENKVADVMKKLNRSLGVHCWSELNRDAALLSTSKNAFNELVRSNCPVLYQEVTKNGWKV